MRLISLLITLLIVAWLIYSQRSPTSSAEPAPAWQQAEAKATTVDPLVQDQFARQAEVLSRMEAGQEPGQAAP